MIGGGGVAPRRGVTPQMSTTNLHRWWCFVLYNDLVPFEVSLERIDSLHIPVVVSPLHDRDMNPDGTPKKIHHHVIMYFEGKKSFNQITSLLNDTIGNVCSPSISVQSPAGMIRYFVHLDNPEKAQYSISDIRTFGGLNISDYFVPSSGQRLQYVKEMTCFIRDNDIVDFARFAVWCADYNSDWFYMLTSCSTLYFKTLITSNRLDHSFAVEEK